MMFNDEKYGCFDDISIWDASVQDHNLRRKGQKTRFSVRSTKRAHSTRSSRSPVSSFHDILPVIVLLLPSNHLCMGLYKVIAFV